MGAEDFDDIAITTYGSFDGFIPYIDNTNQISSCNALGHKIYTWRYCSGDGDCGFVTYYWSYNSSDHCYYGTGGERRCYPKIWTVLLGNLQNYDSFRTTYSASNLWIK